MTRLCRIRCDLLFDAAQCPESGRFFPKQAQNTSRGSVHFTTDSELLYLSECMLVLSVSAQVRNRFFSTRRLHYRQTAWRHQSLPRLDHVGATGNGSVRGGPREQVTSPARLTSRAEEHQIQTS